MIEQIAIKKTIRNPEMLLKVVFVVKCDEIFLHFFEITINIESGMTIIQSLRRKKITPFSNELTLPKV